MSFTTNLRYTLTERIFIPRWQVYLAFFTCVLLAALYVGTLQMLFEAWRTLNVQ